MRKIETLAPCGYEIEAKILKAERFPDNTIRLIVECDCPLKEKCKYSSIFIRTLGKR